MGSILKVATGGWEARWRTPEGGDRRKRFTLKGDAERFLVEAEASKFSGSYVDPRAGRVTVEQYAQTWLDGQTTDMSTQQVTALRIRLHINPVLGRYRIGTLKPSTIQAWTRSLSHLAATYQRTIFANLSTILSSAVDDGLIAKNPCLAASVRKPRVDAKTVVPWTAEQVFAVHDALPEKYRIVATLCAGLGLRQGEAFGLSPEDVDWLRGVVHVRRQVKLYNTNKSAFGLPKGRKTRDVPLPPLVRDELAAHLTKWPAKPITLPWGDLDGKPQTYPLFVVSRESKSLNRNYFNAFIWKSALKAAGMPTTPGYGCHQLRHTFASMALEAGVSIRAVSQYLGHSDPGFTLRTYTHLLKDNDSKARDAIDGMLARPSRGSFAASADE